jgi:signal peptidase I
MATEIERTPEQSQAVKPRSVGNVFWEYVKLFGSALIIALVIKTSLVEAYNIPSSSMEATLMSGDFILGNKFIYGAKIPLLPFSLPAISDPKPGDIVIFKFPDNPSVNYIKRCIAGPGQTVEVRNKRVYVDGVLTEDPEFALHTDPRIRPRNAIDGSRDNFGPVTVPDGHYFMMGDNRDHSFDSRFWGFVPRQNVLGRAMLVHFSWAPDDSAPEIDWTRPKSIIESLAYNISHFNDRVKWDRIGRIIQ